MNSSLKNRWLRALRSGKYHQHQHRLRSEDGKEFCCLGVLCDIINPDGWGYLSAEDGGLGDDPRIWSDVNGEHVYRFDDTPDELVDGSGLASTLIDMNDNVGSSFSQIADFLEKNLRTDQCPK